MDSDALKVRALGLCSGGLDSTLSGIILDRQGIDVEWICFETPFFNSKNAKKAAAKYGIRLIVKNITADYLEMLKNPHCGYGKNMNPCLDCHALMFKLAGKVMIEEGFDFLFSGEVLGQRPMSQTKNSLRYVEKNSGFEGLILRPLSALKLVPTIPEKKGLVDRNRLYDFEGRSRKSQMKLAAELKVTDFPAPAGGCLLTDKTYSRRLKDLFGHQEVTSENELMLLKFGRHFRLDDKTKLIVGRDHTDNENILANMDPKEHIMINLKYHPGPVALLPNSASHENILIGSSICAGYAKVEKNVRVDVVIDGIEDTEMISIKAVNPENFRDQMLS